VAWGGGKYGIAWNDDRSSDEEIYFMRLGCNCVDGDGDGATSCVDCDDTRATVYAGAAQVCDGLNNDCDSTSWPLLNTTNEMDGDGDGISVCAGDCNDLNALVWATPGEVRSLLASRIGSFTATINWTPPFALGGTSVVYDTLRSTAPSNFTSLATCVESNDGSNTTTNDLTGLPPGGALYYLTRAENACPSGQGVLGRNSAGTPTAGRACP
jgi:hypothetical protein